MLPIAHRRTLEVPHGVAALAAAVCLVLAFVSDQSGGEEQQLQAEQSGSSRVEHVTSRDEPSDEAAEARKRTRSGNGKGAIELLPWFTGLGRGGG